MSDIVQELKTALTGWKNYFGIAEVLSPLREIDKWVRRRLRCYAWKQWGSAGYRELRKRGVSVRKAWNTSNSTHGPWRLNQTPEFPGFAHAVHGKRVLCQIDANGYDSHDFPSRTS